MNENPRPPRGSLRGSIRDPSRDRMLIASPSMPGDAATPREAQERVCRLLGDAVDILATNDLGGLGGNFDLHPSDDPTWCLRYVVEIKSKIIDEKNAGV